MGLDFLRTHGAHRMRNYDTQLFLLDNGMMQNTELEQVDASIDLGYEEPPDEWKPKPCAREFGHSAGPADWPFLPTRFIDGKDVGRTVAWLQTREGYPVPVRLSEIGAVVIHNINGELRREFAHVERVVSLMIDPFPWDEVESFAIALREEGFRLLPCNKPYSNDPTKSGYSYDFERMRKTTQNRSNDEMSRLERQALSLVRDVPTIIDGRLEPRRGAFDQGSPVVGLVKTHQYNYLHAHGWQTYYQLRPGQRTPLFKVESPNHDKGRDEDNGMFMTDSSDENTPEKLKSTRLPIVSWYLRLDGERGDLPNWGIVRLEVPLRFFEGTLGKDWEYVDRLSQVICDYRCRDQGYGRAAVSIHPIQRAEESLGALFSEAEMLINRFYRLTNL